MKNWLPLRVDLQKKGLKFDENRTGTQFAIWKAFLICYTYNNMGGVLFNFYMSLILQDSLEVTNEAPALLSGEEEGVEDITKRKLV